MNDATAPIETLHRVFFGENIPKPSAVSLSSPMALSLSLVGSYQMLTYQDKFFNACLTSDYIKKCD